jgi:hypothetical protein
MLLAHSGVLSSQNFGSPYSRLIHARTAAQPSRGWRAGDFEGVARKEAVMSETENQKLGYKVDSEKREVIFNLPGDIEPEDYEY